MSDPTINELIRAKDEEISKLNQVKETLKKKFLELKKENEEIKKELEELKGKASDKGETEKLKKELEEANKKIKELEDKLKETREKAKGKADSKDQIEKELEEDYPIKDLIKQLKTGMFKLGQQNFTIIQKVDKLLEMMSSGIQPSKPGTVAAKPQAAPMAASVRPSAAAVQKNTSQEEYVSPGLMTSNKNAEMAAPTSPSSAVEDSHVVKPSELLKKKGLQVPKVEPVKLDEGIEKPEIPGVSPASGEAVEPEKAEKPSAPKVSATTPPLHAIKTFPYPADGVIKCPYCGAQNYVEQVNKAKIISFVPVKKYGKKYYCKECRGEWDYSY